jgi:hypothetical protein
MIRASNAPAVHRVAAETGRRSCPLADAAPADDDWYADVLMLKRRKCLLLVHDETLLAVLDTDVRVAQFKHLMSYVPTLVVDALASEGPAAEVSARRTRPACAWRRRRAGACSAT